MTGSTLVTSHFLQIFKKTIWNQVLQLYQNNVNLFFDNHLNFMNVPINSHAQLKKLNKKKKKIVSPKTMDYKSSPNFNS